MATEATPINSAALSVRKDGKPALAFIPGNMDEAWRTADALSKSSILPDALRGKPHDILVTIMTGTELGLSPMAAIRDIYVVKGKGYTSALLKVALVKQSPECEYFRCVESTELKAVFETKRRGEGLTRFEYTLEDAKRAGLYGAPKKQRADGKEPEPSNWDKNPKLMMRRRCESELAEEVYPDIVRGLGNRDDLIEEHDSRTMPTTFAPRAPAPAPAKPEHEDAQLVEETKPIEAMQSVSELVDAQRAVEEVEMKAAAPAPVREPGSDDGEEQAPAPTPSKVAAVEPLKPGEDLAIYAAVSAATTVAELDTLAIRAKAIQGPGRGELISAFKQARARVAGR